MGIGEILKSLDKYPVIPEDISYWFTTIEVTARHMCNDKHNEKIILQYCPDEKVTRFFLKD